MATTPPPRSHWTLGRIVDLALSLLAVVFLVVFLVQAFGDVSPRTNRRLNLVATLIWIIFGVDFFVRLAFAPDRTSYLRHNWLAAVALLLPMLRILRVFQIAKVAPSVPAAGVIEGSRRGTVELRHAFAARPALYLAILTLFVIVLSSVGMYAIERHSDKQPNITGLEDGLWWTMATLTTIGSELYPVTVEGRALAIVIMIYSVGFAGYVTGSFVSLLLGVSPSSPPQTLPADADLRDEIRALREQVAALSPASAPPPNPTTPAESVPAQSSTVSPRT